jgi:8-oxo-dGTP pyrophosphatase MutT (NUDIX family)
VDLRRADDCLTVEGARIAPFYVLEYPDWVQVVDLDDEDHVLLVEQYRHGLGLASLELPAGGVEPADAGPLQAAARELLEETGFTASDWRYIGALSPNAASHNNRTHIVLALGARPEQGPEDNPAERMNIIRLPAAEVIGRVMAGEIVQAMHVASLAMALTAVGKWAP